MSGRNFTVDASTEGAAGPLLSAPRRHRCPGAVSQPAEASQSSASRTGTSIATTDSAADHLLRSDLQLPYGIAATLQEGSAGMAQHGGDVHTEVRWAAALLGAGAGSDSGEGEYS